LVKQEGEALAMTLPAFQAELWEPPEGMLEALGGEPLEVLRANYALVVYDTEREIRQLRPDFRALVEKEVYGEERPGGRPRYLDYCRKFGIEWEPFSDQGHMRYGPEATLMMDILAEYAWRCALSLGLPVFKVRGTNMFNLDVEPVKQHAQLYGDRLYTVEVDNENTFTSPLVFTATVENRSTSENSSVTITTALPDGVYYWRVRAADNAGNTGAWSAIWSFRITTARPAAPTLLSPENGSWIEENRPTLRWSAVTDPSGIKYVVQVDNDNMFSPPLHENMNLTDNSYRLPIALPEGRYFWRVKAVSGAGLESDWSSVWTFGVDNSIPGAPVIVSPAQGENTNDNTPVLVWQPVVDPSGVRYSLQVDNDENFVSPLLSLENISAENYAFENALPDGRWYWRVRAVDGAGHAGSWSTSWFTVDTVPPVVSLTQTPPSTTTENSATFSGTATDATTIVSAVEYRVNSGNWVSVSITPGRTVSFSFTISNLSAGSYTVEVRARDNVGNVSSPVSYSFSVVAGDFSISISPENVRVRQGESANVTVRVLPVQGFSQAVSLSISGLPGGVTASFSPQSGTPPFTSTLTISVGPTAEPGTYSLTITATGGGRTHQATLTLTVELPAAPGPGVSWTTVAAIVVALAVVVIIVLRFLVFA